MVSPSETELHLNNLNKFAVERTLLFKVLYRSIPKLVFDTLYTSTYVPIFKINLFKTVLHTKISCILCIDS